MSHHLASVPPTDTNRVVDKLKTSYTLINQKPPGRNRTVITGKNITRLKRQLDLSPRRSIRSLSKQLKMSTDTLWKILRKELAVEKYPYKIQLKQTQTPKNKSDSTVAKRLLSGYNRRILRKSLDFSFNWLVYSPDLIPCDFYLWGFL